MSDAPKGPAAGRPVYASIVVPLMDEEESIDQLHAEITETMSKLGHSYEVIYVDDGSTDTTFEKLEAIQSEDEHVCAIQFRRNFGQTAAMAAGFDHARGEVIVPMDGDLQNDPADIPRLLEKLDEGYDIVSGWRKNRKDKTFTRKIPSKMANWLIGVVTGVKIHDYGCSLKAYRADVVKHIKLYGEMHRFIPAIASWHGASIAELAVNHRPRVHGVTKYGLIRTLKVVLDLITVKFLGGYGTKPIYFFGAMAMVLFAGASVSGAFVAVRKLIDGASMVRNPMLLLTVLLLVLSAMCIMLGLLAELMVRTYHESQNKPVYVIRRKLE
ncbi:MAG: glycosyltransferase family 2 protein [Planctomycetota bacterium]